MNTLALELIAECKRTGAKELDLGRCGLRDWPEELLDLEHLEKLVLSNSYWDHKENKRIYSKNQGMKNFLSTIPSKISKLKCLKALIIAGDPYDNWKIVDLSNLKTLEQLQILDLDSNQICKLQGLEGLTNLQYLGLSGKLCRFVW